MSTIETEPARLSLGARAVRPAPRAMAVPVIAGVGTAVPDAFDQHALWESFGSAYFAAHPLAGRLWRSSGVARRHLAVDPGSEQVSEWSTGRRMARYADESPPLGHRAVAEALRAAGVAPADVGLFAVVSCTGYTTPGLDILLARDLGMPPTVRRLMVGHMGCYGAIPGLGSAAEFVAVRRRPAVLLCLELPSLHVQPRPPQAARRPTGDEIEQMVAHALFADAACALVLAPDGAAEGPGGAVGGFEVLDVAATTDAHTIDHMAWRITDHGFRMRLSAEVPDVLRRHVRGAVTGLLAAHGLALDDVRGYAVHPGGLRIVRAVAAELSVDDADLAPSYDVLRDYGNCSSGTVLLVLRRLLATGRVRSGDHVVALAFGPGLTLFAALLRHT